MTSTSARSIRLAITVALGGFIFGFDASVISGVVGFISVEYNLNDWQIGLVVSAPTLGAILSGATAGPLSDRFGRKTLLIVIAALYLVSAICSAFAPNYQALVIARFVGGLAFASLGIAPIYIAEISQATMRGRMISINQFNIVIGFSAAYFANYFLLQFSHSGTDLATSLGVDTNTWRWMLGLEILPAAIYLLMLFGIPESPRWLAMHRRCDEARAILVKLMGEDKADREMDDIDATLHKDPAPVFQRIVTLFSPGMIWILGIVLMLSVIQQITGINAIYFYAPTIFEQSGVGTDAAFSQAIFVGIINVIFTIFAMLLIDRLGRKPLLIIGLTGILVSMSLCAYGFYTAKYQLTAEAVEELATTNPELNTEQLSLLIGRQWENDVAYKKALTETLGQQQARTHQSHLLEAGTHMNAYIVLIGILGFVASFAFSLGPVMWVMQPELFPNHLRGVGMAMAGIVNSFASFVVQFVFPWELNTLGAGNTFALYGLFAVISLVLVIWILPETRGKSLEQLEFELKNQKLGGQPS